MRNYFAIALFLSLPAAAQTIASVTNGFDQNNTVLAPGALFTVYGSGLGPPQFFAPPPPYLTAQGPYAIVLSNSEGQETRAFLYSLFESASTGILPSTLAPGLYQVSVISGSSRSRPFPVRVAERAFSLATRLGNGRGPAFATLENRMVTMVAPAKPGDVVALIGTGLGASPGRDDQPDAQPLSAEVDVLIGKTTVRAEAAGRGSLGAGVDQIRFTMPADAEVGEGCYVPLRVRVNGAWSNYVSIPKTNEGTRCEHPLGLSESILRRIDNNELLILGSFGLRRNFVDVAIPSATVSGRTFVASGRFSAGRHAQLLETAGRPEGSALPPGECSSSTSSVVFDRVPNLDELVLSLTSSRFNLTDSTLDGGARAVVTTPSSLTLAINNNQGILLGGLDETDPIQSGSIAPGEWQVQWPGGAHIAPGRATLTVNDADPVQWDAPFDVINANEALPLKWAYKGTPAETGVTINGVFLAPGQATAVEIGAFTCRASGTEFTVPKEILSAMPVSASGRALIRLEGRSAATAFAAETRVTNGTLDYGNFAQFFTLMRVRPYAR